MNGLYLNRVLQINAAHSLYRADGKWYHNLKRFPDILFDDNGYIIFPTEESYTCCHPKLQRKKDLHIVDGISSLIEYVRCTQEQRLLMGDTIGLVRTRSRNSFA